MEGFHLGLTQSGMERDVSILVQQLPFAGRRISISAPQAFILKGCSLNRSVGISSRSLATQMPVSFSPKAALRIRFEMI
jgi:hypothetical protein